MDMQEIKRRTVTITTLLKETGLSYEEMEAVWDECIQFQKKLDAHRGKYLAKRPKMSDYASKAAEEWDRDLNAWSMEMAMSKPNPPGYEFANND